LTAVKNPGTFFGGGKHLQKEGQNARFVNIPITGFILYGSGFLYPHV
jgi:hypothetical protein